MSDPTRTQLDATLEALYTNPTGVAEVAGDPAAIAEFVDVLVDVLVDGGHVAAADVRRCAPARDRWAVAEVAEEVLRPVAALPQGRGWLVVVADAASMAPAAAARLLRTIEEPPAPVWFVLCRDLDEHFEVPVAGRITHSVTLAGDDVDPRLRAALERAGVLERFEELVGSAPRGRTPLAAAGKWSAGAREVAKALRPKPAGPWLRRIVRAALERWSEQVTATLRAHPGDRGVQLAADRFARAAAEARTAVGLFVPPESSLGVVVAALGEVHAAAEAATAQRT